MSDHSDIWKYAPSIPLAVIAAAVFIALTGIHGYQLFRTKTWYFIAFWIGGVCECVGYLTRIWSAEQKPDYQVGPFAISAVAILIAPSLFAASMYMELGRIIRLCGGEAYAIVRVTWLTKIFVIGDVIAFLTQAGGAGLSSSDKPKTADLGNKIIIVGLAVQIVFFGLFVLVSIIFHMRARQRRTEKMIQFPHLPWQKHLVNIYAASVLVLIRCVFRLIEYAMGTDAYLYTNEWPTYVFDTLLMIIVMVAFAVIHPSEVKALLAGRGLVMSKVILTRHVTLSRSERGEELLGREPKSLSASDNQSFRV